MDKSVYAASLGDLLRRSGAGKPYWDRSEFNRLTYRTRGLANALEDIRVRLHEGRGNGFRQIETSFGGGKTHSMIAMYHMCRDWDAMPIVIDGTDLDPSTQTVWGEMERQLDGKIDKMSGKVVPGGAAILKLLERPKAILVLIDEIAHYLDGSKGVDVPASAGAAKIKVGESNMAVQTVNFLQKLFNKVGQMPHVCVVISLPDSDQVLEEKYYRQVQQVAGRQKQVVTVATDDDIPHIIRRRLFDTDEAIMSDRAADIIQSYVDKCVAGRSIPRDEADAYVERFRATYPFTPDVIDVLYGRWGSYPTFQRTRGALRLLSGVVHSLLKSDRPYITLSDIDLRVDEIRKELIHHAGANMESVISLDITSKQSNAVRHGDVGVRAARAIFMYSFPAEHKGATRDDVKRAAFTPKDDHSVVGDTLDSLRRSLFFLELTNNRMFRFTHTENINKIIDRAKHSVSDDDADVMEHRILQEGAGSKFRRTYVWPDHTSRIDDIPGLQLVIMKRADMEYCKQLVTNVGPKSGRVNQNALVFVMPASDGLLSTSIRELLAIRDVRSRMEGLKPADINVLDDAERRAKGGIESGLREKYTEVWLPNREEVIRRCSIASRHPDEDKLPLGDVMWEKLVGEFQIAERLDPKLLSGYEGGPEDIFNRMMRTCGERRPASLDVVRTAMEVSVEMPPPPSGEGALRELDRDGTIGDSLPPGGQQHPGQSEHQEPFKKHVMPPIAGLHCTDVMDRETMAAWGGSIFTTLRDNVTTTVQLIVDQRNENTFSVQLDMTGSIPRDVANSIRESVSAGGKYYEDESW